MNDKLTSRTLNRDEDPQDLFYEIDRGRTRLEQMGEIISDCRYEDIIIQALLLNTTTLKTRAIAT